MRALERKLLRDAWHYRGQLIAITLVVASGIALFVSLRSMHGHLRDSRDAYYASSRFAHVFSSVRRAPMAAAREVARIHGVSAVDARVVADVVADVAGLEEPARVRLVSIEVPRAAALNDVHLAMGRWPEVGRPDEAVASRAFAAANRLSLGDSVGVVLNGRWRWLHLVGVGISPEYVYEIASGGIFPDNRRFGVLWMGRESLAATLDLTGAFNDLAIALRPGTDPRAVVDEVDSLMAPFGTGGSYDRSEQLSHQFLDGEIDETQVTSILMPAIFLGVTAFLLHVVIGRLVGMQREQVATLKAFGYRDGAVALHYLGLALLPVLAGTVLGVALGHWFAVQLAEVYARFYQFPAARFRMDWAVVQGAVAVGMAAGLVGALGAVWRALRLPPAEAMRPEAPARFHRGALEALAARVAPSPRQVAVVRGLVRRPWRTGLSITALALAGGLVITTQGMFDSVDFIRTLQFDVADRGDVTVLFREAQPRAAVRALAREPGVVESEGFRAIPVAVRHHAARFRTVLFAYPTDAALRRVVSLDRVVRRIPEDGVVLARSLAERLAARVGDQVQLQLLDGERRVEPLTVAGVNDDLLGSAAYVHPSVARRLDGGEVFSGAALRIVARDEGALFQRLKAMPAVSGVVVRRATLEGFDRTIGESFRISLVITLAFACVIAGGIVYNSARVALSERGRELASLRILGFSPREVAAMLLTEQAMLTLASLPFAFLVAYFFTWLITVRFASTLFRIPLVAEPATYLFGATVIVAAAAASAVLVRRRLDRLDLGAVLKTRE
jgi:putative ABC transport system permease protein